MDSERWGRLNKLLHDALDRAPEERDAFLRQACGGDDATPTPKSTVVPSTATRAATPPASTPPAPSSRVRRRALIGSWIGRSRKFNASLKVAATSC